jgi:predicted ATPase
MAAGPYIQTVRVTIPAGRSGYPFNLPVVASLAQDGGLDLAPGVTFLVGENGSGKSTLIEAVAVAAGFNPEGGSRNFQFRTRSTESELGNHLTLVRGTRRPKTGYFLRAESYYNVASEIERINADPDAPGLIDIAYGGVSPHEQSHGESFLSLIVNRFGPNGLYLLDEPEAALSIRGCMAVMSRVSELVEQGSQFVIATHSPILLALPEATILELDEDGRARRTTYDEALPVRLTREFLAEPQRFLRHLL